MLHFEVKLYSVVKGVSVDVSGGLLHVVWISQNQVHVTYCEHPVSIVEVVTKKSSSQSFCGSFYSLLPSKKVQPFWTLKKP